MKRAQAAGFRIFFPSSFYFFLFFFAVWNIGTLCAAAAWSNEMQLGLYSHSDSHTDAI